jgi:hypothetical protein
MVGRMPEFLAETYTPRGAPRRTPPTSRAAEQADGLGGPVRFPGAIVVPEEETCFWLYQAPSAAAVRAAMTAAGLRPERITEAVAIRPPAPSPDRPGTCSGPPHRTPRPGPRAGPP